MTVKTLKSERTIFDGFGLIGRLRRRVGSMEDGKSRIKLNALLPEIAVNG